jgi:hypothetical protein
MPSRQGGLLLDDDEGDGLEPPAAGDVAPPGPALTELVTPGLPAGPGGLVLPGAVRPAFARPWVPSSLAATVTVIVVPGGTSPCGVRETTVPGRCPVPAAYLRL